MSRQHLHFRRPNVGDLVHPLEYRGPANFKSGGSYADTERVGLVIEKQGLEVLVQFAGEKDDSGNPYRLWYRRTNVITIDGVREIP